MERYQQKHENQRDQNNQNEEYEEVPQTTEVNRIDINNLRDTVSKCDHRYRADYGNRLIVCIKCGYGFSFLIHEIEETSDELKIPIHKGTRQYENEKVRVIKKSSII